jgi:hypothetical protein
MRTYVLLSAVIITLLGCASTTTITLSNEEKQAIKTVSIELPTTVDTSLDIRAVLFDDYWKGNYKGHHYKTYKELHQVVYEESNIDIKQIVLNEIVKQIDSAGKLQRVSENGDIVIGARIAQYGYFPPAPFTTNLSPKITLILKGTLRSGKKVWEAKGSVSPFSEIAKSHDPTELVNKPEIIRQDYEKITTAAVNEALKSYREQIIK